MKTIRYSMIGKYGFAGSVLCMEEEDYYEFEPMIYLNPNTMNKAAVAMYQGHTDVGLILNEALTYIEWGI